MDKLEVVEKFRLSDYASKMPHNFGFWNSGLIYSNDNFIMSCRNETSMYNEEYYNRKVPTDKRWESYCPSFVYFDKNFNFLKSAKINKTDESRYEDVRLFHWKNEIYCTGTVKSLQKGKVDQFLGKKINDSIFRLKFNHPYPLHQKNWSPIVDDKQNLYFEYSPGPLRKLLYYKYPELLEVNSYGNKFNFRGNVPFIDLGDSFLGFYHFSNKRNYYHVVVLLEKEFPFKLKKISNSFKFSAGNAKIQFLMGATQFEDLIILSYGIQDSDNIVASVPLETLKRACRAI